MYRKIRHRRGDSLTPDDQQMLVYLLWLFSRLDEQERRDLLLGPLQALLENGTREFMNSVYGTILRLESIEDAA